MRSAIHLFALSLGATLSVAAQTAVPMGVPMVGFVLDSSAQLRPVIGIPGAANLGPATSLDTSVQVLAIAPHQDYFVALQGDAQDLIVVRRPAGDGAKTVLVPGVGPVRVTLSPRGTAMLLTPSGQVWTAMSGNAASSWTADLSALGASASAFAVSDDGQAVLAAAPSADHVSIFLATPNGAARVLSTVSSLGGLAFLPGRLDALVGDAQANQIQIVREVTGQALSTLVADSSAGIAGPVDLAGSEDARTVFVANSKPGGVTIVSLDSGAGTNLTCVCTPSVLARMSAASVFRLTDSAAGLFWIFDGGASQRIVAIPPDPSTAQVRQ